MPVDIPHRAATLGAMSFVVKTGSARLHVEQTGAGPPIVLLHGGPGAYDYLGDSALADMLAAGHTVYSYDQRGCRHSPSPGPFTVAAHVADLEAVREHVGAERMSLLGHSWGGFLAMAYAVAHPPRVARMILLSSAGPRGGWRQAFADRLEANHTPEQRAELRRIDQRLARTRDRGERERLYHERFNVALPSYVAPAHRAAAPRMEYYAREVNIATMGDALRLEAQDTLPRRLAARRIPALIVHGTADPIPWSVVDDLRAALPRAVIVRLENCGHFPWLETPQALEEALADFLRA
jgi:proline iminopeptidase